MVIGSMGDSTAAGLYSWWLSIGGTGEVLEPPSDGWFGHGNPGKFQFTSPPNLKVPCWFVQEPDHAQSTAPLLRVRLSDEPISQFRYWIGLVGIAIVVVVLLAFSLHMCHTMTCEKYQREWQRLEDEESDLHG